MQNMTWLQEAKLHNTGKDKTKREEKRVAVLIEIAVD
jgi:hypothetical protein